MRQPQLGDIVLYTGDAPRRSDTVKAGRPLPVFAAMVIHVSPEGPLLLALFRPQSPFMEQCGKFQQVEVRSGSEAAGSEAAAGCWSWPPVAPREDQAP